MFPAFPSASFHISRASSRRSLRSLFVFSPATHVLYTLLSCMTSPGAMNCLNVSKKERRSFSSRSLTLTDIPLVLLTLRDQPTPCPSVPKGSRRSSSTRFTKVSSCLSLSISQVIAPGVSKDVPLSREAILHQPHTSRRTTPCGPSNPP